MFGWNRKSIVFFCNKTLTDSFAITLLQLTRHWNINKRTLTTVKTTLLCCPPLLSKPNNLLPFVSIKKCTPRSKKEKSSSSDMAVKTENHFHDAYVAFCTREAQNWFPYINTSSRIYECDLKMVLSYKSHKISLGFTGLLSMIIEYWKTGMKK